MRSPAGGQGTETILLVEDDEAVQRLAARVLEAHGYRVLAAESGPEAIRTSEGHDGPIHLLLTDVIMPDMDGKELATQLHDQRPETRVLYMSGHDDDLIAHHGVLEEGIAFLSKPFDVEALTLKVQAVLAAPLEQS
jgi:DNA-binding response OmpR family regulator